MRPKIDSPYRSIAAVYHQLGWSPIPLPYNEKWPPPDMVTGEHGQYVTEEQLRSWLRPDSVVKSGEFSYPPGNIALRMPRGLEFGPESEGWDQAVEACPELPELLALSPKDSRGTWDVLVVDVDAYNGKAGGATLAAAEKAWGRLPATWRNSSRVGDPVSGHRFFFVPSGLHWPGDLRSTFGQGVELLRWDHRYAIVPPSINPDSGGLEYFWRKPDGTPILLSDVANAQASDAGGDTEIEVELPSAYPADMDLSWMPKSWVLGLTGGAGATARRKLAGSGGGELTTQEVRDWLRARDNELGPDICRVMGQTLRYWQNKVRIASDDGGAHEAARDGAWALIGDSHAGHAGVSQALLKLRDSFMSAVAGRREPRVARGEWARIVRRGVSKVAAEGNPAPNDGCDYAGARQDDSSAGSGHARGSKRSGKPTDDRRRKQAGAADTGDTGYDEEPPTRKVRRSAGAAGGSAYDYPRNDDGNGQRFRRSFGAEVRWVSAGGGWYYWDKDSALWRLDLDDVVVSGWAKDVVREMEDEAAAIEDPKVRVEFLRFVRASGNAGKIAGGLVSMRSEPGMTATFEDFDSRPDLLHCSNGVLELNRDPARPVHFRPPTREDMFTISTGVPYDPTATHGLWDKFLDKFLPEQDLRIWAQKLAGYSLFGRNSARVFVLCKGETTTGKTTFAEAVRESLGGYAGPFGLTLFRDNQDERPRVDILEAISRRVVFTEEVSSAWRLHADQIKRATGDGVWQARSPYSKAYFKRVPAFTPWIATNNTPTIEGNDPALRRRMRVIPFLHQIPEGEEEPQLKEKMLSQDVLAAVFAWVVAGWQLYLNDETLTDIPAAAVEATMQVHSELSTDDEMLHDMCVFGRGFVVPAQDLIRAYEQWAAQNVTERERMSPNKFGRMLSEKGYAREVRREGDKTIRYRKGLKLRPEWARLTAE